MNLDHKLKALYASTCVAAHLGITFTDKEVEEFDTVELLALDSCLSELGGKIDRDGLKLQIINDMKSVIEDMRKEDA
ncbi:hypothetical protein ABND12_20060 [Paenibacillus larvae]